jgi:hypothetical protein
MKGKLLISLVMIYCQQQRSNSKTGHLQFMALIWKWLILLKKNYMSDADGNFWFTAKTNDILVFISKQHQLRSLPVTRYSINGVLVELILNAEELNEF